MIKFFRFGECKLASDPFWKEENVSSFILLPFKAKQLAVDFYNECLLLEHDRLVTVQMETSGDAIVCVKIYCANKGLREEAQRGIMDLYFNRK